MRYLGIDYGTKKIGVAISDEEGKFAFPKEIVPNNEKALIRIGKILEDEKIRQIVVGESLNFEGRKNNVAEEIEGFISSLEANFSAKIHKEKEFLTTVEARRYNEDGGKVDASAAALILQRFLDRQNK